MIPKSDLKFFSSLKQKKFRNESGLFVLEGEKLINEAFDEDIPIQHIIASKEFLQLHPIKIDQSKILVASEKDLERITSLKKAPPIIAIVKQFSDESINMNSPLIIALEQINDPGNFGTIIRTCDWFGVNQIICSENCVEKYNPKVVQASMGSLFRVNINYVNLIDELTMLKQNNNFKIVVATMQGDNLRAVDKKEKQVIILGSESHGISNEVENLADVNISIPRIGNAESLNVSIAHGIVLWELLRA